MLELAEFEVWDVSAMRSDICVSLCSSAASCAAWWYVMSRMFTVHLAPSIKDSMLLESSSRELVGHPWVDEDLCITCVSASW